MAGSFLFPFKIFVRGLRFKRFLGFWRRMVRAGFLEERLTAV